jgi:hypothetical protein
MGVGGEDYKEDRKNNSGLGLGLGLVDIGKRDRKNANYSENDMFNDLMGTAGGGSGPRKAKDITFNDFHFFDEVALRPLLLKERGMRAIKENGIERIELVDRVKLTPEEKSEKEMLMAEGFGHWGRRDFLAFIRGCAEHGIQNIHEIAQEIEGKTVTEVRRYAAVFWERGADDLADWEKHRAKIEEGQHQTVLHRLPAN